MTRLAVLALFSAVAVGWMSCQKTRLPRKLKKLSFRSEDSAEPADKGYYVEFL